MERDRLEQPAEEGVNRAQAELWRRRKPELAVPVARRVVAAAVRLLPPADRARYDEEYRAELWDLAHAGAGRSGR
jgi:hypothetical protein